MKSKTSRRSPDNPPPDERRAIAARIALLPLMRRDGTGVLDWPAIAGRLAEQLAATTRRLAASPVLSEADAEHVARAEVLLREFRRAREAGL